MTSPLPNQTSPGLKRYYYKDTIADFLLRSPQEILGRLAEASEFPVEPSQRDAWLEEIRILNGALEGLDGTVYFEYSIPRMGRRIDVLALIGPVLFVLEFKVGATDFDAYAIDQVWDYALDLKNFHEASHDLSVAPVLVCTRAQATLPEVFLTPHDDKLLLPIKANAISLREVIWEVLRSATGPAIDAAEWQRGRYKPTPTIIEAATALYTGHSVNEISRSDAAAINLSRTSEAVSEIIRDSRDKGQKAICLVTGVPGAGKTLVGLNIATQHINQQSDLYSVFLSGNGPLVDILREALTRDKVRQEKERGRILRKKAVMSNVKAFIQNAHHFRDDCLIDQTIPPIEHVALFDEAQRAWTLEQTAKFMQQKKHISGFDQSEPQFLISCLDRHPDWAVVVCLIGGGQEINTGEAGMSEWIDALTRSFGHWRIFVSSRLTDSEYGAGAALETLDQRSNVTYLDDLHLSVSMRSFRAENVSLLVKQLLDLDMPEARNTLAELNSRYPVVITRDLPKAKQWLRARARGSERFGLVASSQAERLRPHAVHVKAPMDPVHWFLDGKQDVRSSYYLEDVATEFSIQGLELDWACVVWDADFRYADDGWEHWSFRGDRWQHINMPEKKKYQKNAYRVLLTRARQGMVIVVPPGSADDPTRRREFYDPTFAYLQNTGFQLL